MLDSYFKQTNNPQILKLFFFVSDRIDAYCTNLGLTVYRRVIEQITTLLSYCEITLSLTKTC